MLSEARMSDERKKEIEQRCEKATPGPWVPCERGAESPEFYVAYKDATKPHGMALGTCFWPCHAPEETEWAENITYDTVDFIAHARTDIPLLLSHIETLRDENERLTQQIQDIAEELGCTEKTSHRHSHGRCIFTALETLRSQVEQDRLRWGGSHEQGGYSE